MPRDISGCSRGAASGRVWYTVETWGGSLRQLAWWMAMGLLAMPVSGMAQQRAASEARVALVIGNANYKDAPLANPVNDARAVAKALNGLGFKVSLRVNLSQTQLRRAIREFGD